MNVKEHPKEILEGLIKAHGLKKLLEAIAKRENGVEAIREVLKNYNKNARKKSSRVNIRDEIVRDVYELMYKSEHTKENAINRVSEQRKIVAYTVRNHVQSYEKEHKNLMFKFTYTVDYIVPSDFRHDEVITILSEILSITPIMGWLYYQRIKDNRSKLKNSDNVHLLEKLIIERANQRLEEERKRRSLLPF